jgi:cytochrome P450
MKTADHAPARCPFESAGDDRKSARLAAEQLQYDPSARLVESFAFGREILRSPAMRQAADIGADRFDINNHAATPVIFLDGEPHRRKRAAIAKFFTPKAMSTQYHAVMEAATNTLLHKLQDSGCGRLDVISFELAVTVASEIVGLTNSNMAAMSGRIASAFASGTARRRGRIDEAIGSLLVALKTLYFFYRDVRPAIAARRKARREDVISQLLDQGASEKAILMECMVYASAGMVTTREFIVMAAWHLFDRADLRQRFIDGDEQEQFAILDEVLRLEPVAGLVHRRAAEDLPDTLGGQVHAGDQFAIDIRAANTDEAVVGPSPRSLNPDRAGQTKTAGAHLSFGDGPHRCPGAQVAMHETRIFLDALFRLPGLHLERAPDMLWNSSLMSYELRKAVVVCDRK